MGRARPAGAHRVEVTEVAPPGAGADYASAFEVAAFEVAASEVAAVEVAAGEVDGTGGDERRPEEWIRVALEEAPRVLRWLVVAGWRYVLRLRLGPRSSPSHVAGWTIVTNTPKVIVLEVGSPLITAHKVLRLEDDRAVMTTFVHYERPAGRALWKALAPVHHRTEPYLLGRAASRLRPRTD